jgi:hypothetical protein
MTARRLLPADLPGWPRAMRAHLAAAYVGGICVNTLHSLVAAGILPPPVRLGLNGGSTPVWLREDLDAALDALRGPESASLSLFRDADDDDHAPAPR